jgi:predicted RNA-binding protein with PIN domain
MSQHVVIDGNNLLHAMHDHAPIPNVGRETLVRIIERWARQGDNDVTLVFDGPTPHGGLADQMRSSRIKVLFSSPQTADDVIVAMIHRAPRPDTVRVVTSDTAIRHEAGLRRCLHTYAVAFVHELFATEDQPHRPTQASPEKPRNVSPEEAKEWMELFGIDDDDQPFDGHDAMTR